MTRTVRNFYEPDGTGTSMYVYDSLGRLTSGENGAGATVDYGYDLVGRVLTITYPSGQTVTQTYDPVGNLISVTDWLGHTTPKCSLRRRQSPDQSRCGLDSKCHRCLCL